MKKHPFFSLTICSGLKKMYALVFDGACLLIMFLSSGNICGQANPVPQNLPYANDFSTLLSTAATYPIGWQGWQLSNSGSSGSFRTAAPIGDLALVPSATAVNNTGTVYNYNGKIGFLSSSIADPSICLAIITTGSTDISVSYDIMTIRNPYDGISNTRVNEATLQYRIGTTGSFISLTGIEYQNNSISQTTATTAPQNSVSKNIILPAACNNQAVVQLRWVQRDNAGAGSRPGFAIDNISISAAPIIIGTIATTPFCVSPTGASSGTLSFNSTGAYISNIYAAWLSDASGSFSVPVNIGSLVSDLNADNINIAIPANTPPGAAYQVRLSSSSPIGMSIPGAPFTIYAGPAVVTGTSLAPGDTQVTIGWTNPVTCFDDVMIVAKISPFSAALPAGNTYVANSTSFTDILNGLFDGGVVVYKGTASLQTITSLVNGTNYYFKIFTRKNNDWIAAPAINASPSFMTAATDYFRSNIIVGSWANAASWQSSHDNSLWFAATSAPTSLANTINIISGHAIEVTNAISLDQTVIAGTLELQTGGILNINNGTGDDVSISANGILKIISTNNYSIAVNAGASAIKVETGGKITIGDGSAGIGNGYESFATSVNNNWENASIFEHNCLTTFSSSGLTYFPNAAINTRPLFRVSAISGNPGAANFTTINGLLEVNSSFRFIGAGAKIFRDGIIGTATLNLDAGLGTTTISGIGAVLGGSLTLVLNKQLNLTNGVNVPLGASVIVSGSLTNGITKNAGSFLVNGTIDITDRTISNVTGNVTINGRLKTSRVNGLYSPGNIASGIINLQTGSTIEYNASANQSITSSATLGQAYYNLTFSGSGTKTPNSAIDVSTNGNVTITGATVIVDATINNIGLSTANAIGLNMDNGRLILGTSPGTALPLMNGAYNITGGIIQYNYSGLTTQTIRNKSYQHIEITGSNVGNSSGNINLNAGGTFTVKPGGLFTISDNSITGISGNQTVTVENGGLFKAGNNEGFHGFVATLTNNSAVHANVETIMLHSGSTIEYYRSGNQQITNTPAIAYQNIILSGSGNKTAPVGSLTVAQNLTGLGSAIFVHNNGTVIMNGTAGQVYTAANPFSFYNFTNSSAKAGGGLLINSNMLVVKELKLNSLSQLNLNFGDITLQSGISRTANVAAIPNETNIIIYGGGRFNVERYFPGDRSWRLITSPLSTHNTTGTIFSNWQNNGVYTAGLGAFVTGPNPTGSTGNGIDDSNFDNYSLKTFQANAYVNIGNTISPLSGNSLSAANPGYFMFVRGDRRRGVNDNTIFPNTNATTLSSRGKLQVGSQMFDVSNPAIVSPPAFALVGNPYASSVDFNLLTFNNVNPNRFYTWDPHINQVGAFVVMENDGSGSFLPTVPFTGSPQRNFIQSSQAFFVERISVGAANIVFEEANKSADNTPALFRPLPGAGFNTAKIRTTLLIVRPNNSTTLADGNVAEFRADYTQKVDIQDALKFTNIHENLGFKRDGKILAVERRPEIATDDTIFYHLTKTAINKYRLEIDPENIDPSLSATLEDNFTNIKIPVSLRDTTLYDFNITTVAASHAADRFRMVFRKAVVVTLPVTIKSIKAFRQEKNITIQWAVENELNIRRYEVEKSTDGINFTSIDSIFPAGVYGTQPYNRIDHKAVAGNNFYRIAIVNFSGRVEYSRIVNVNMGDALPDIRVYPNPVINGVISLQFINMPAGKYEIRLLNILGQVMKSKAIDITTANAFKTVVPFTQIVKGIYHVEIIYPGNKKSALKVIYK